MRLQHWSVPDDKFCDRTVVVWPGLEVQPQVRGVGFHEQGLLWDARFISFRFGRDNHAGRGAPDFVVGYNVRLISLTARQVLHIYGMVVKNHRRLYITLYNGTFSRSKVICRESELIKIPLIDSYTSL